MGVISVLLRPLFSTVFIGVNLGSTSCVVSVKRIRPTGTVVESVNEFKIVNHQPSMDVVKYIRRLKNRYPFSYVATVSKVHSQYLEAGSTLSRDSSSGRGYVDLVVQNAVIGIREGDVARYSTLFGRGVELDYLFSPLMILHVMSKDYLTDNQKLFLLQEKDYVSFLVASRDRMFCGKFMSISTIPSYQSPKPTPSEQLKESDIKYEDSDLGDLGELEDLDSDLEDLDSLDFDFKDEDSDGSGLNSMDDLQDLARAGNVAGITQEFLKEYYSNDRYDSDFVDEIVLFDTYGMSPQAVEHIRQVVMIDVGLQVIDINSEIIRMCVMQLKEGSA